MNIFDIARKQVEKEGKINSPNVELLILDRAVTIRRWLDRAERNRKVALSRYKK